MINNVLNNMEKLSFYDALLEGKVELFDRVLLYTESSNLGVEYDYEEITILEVNRSIPNKIIIKYKINTGSSEGSIGQMLKKHLKDIICFLYLMINMKKK